jgi:site-specific DNA-methyltransferase (adenine-specific)
MYGSVFQRESGYRPNWHKENKKITAGSSTGRWPANVVIDDSDEVMRAFAAFGEKSSGVLKAGTKRADSSRHVHCYGQQPKVAALSDFGGDTGTAARFFYCSKADSDSRFGSRHPTIKPLALMQWLVKLVTPYGGTVLDPFSGSGTTGAAAIATGRKAILIEREPQYCDDIRERLRHCVGEGRHSLASLHRAAREREPLPLFADIRENA